MIGSLTLSINKICSPKHIYVFFFSCAACAAFFKNFGYASLLSPLDFGAVSLALLIVNLGIYLATPGILESLSREVPILNGQGVKIDILRSTALITVFVLSVIAGLILLIAVLIISAYYPQYKSLLLASPLLVLTALFNALLCDLQIRELSTHYAKALFLKNISPLLIILIPGPYHPYEILLAESFAIILCILWILSYWCKNINWVFEFKTSRRLIKQGIPFTLSNVCQNIGITLDRWAVQFCFGIAILGSYSFIMSFTMLGLILVNMMQVYSVPRLLSAFGATGNSVILIKKALKTALLTGAALCLLGFPFFMLFPHFVQIFYPQYKSVSQMAPWAYIGLITIAMSFYDVLFRACGRGKDLLFIQGGMIIVAGICSIVAVACKAPLLVFVLIFVGIRILSLLLGWSIGIKKILIC